MKAIIVREFGGPEVLRLEERSDPEPGENQVLVHVRAVGVNPVDAYRRSGRYASLPSLPYTPGSDAAGEVLAVGPGVSRWRRGDRVYTDHRATGAYAQLLVCREDLLHPLPDGVTFAAGATLGVPYATAYRALMQRGGARPGERVLVHGATGGVGLAAVQLARAAGMHVVATGGSEQGRDLAGAHGAEVLLDHTRPDHADRLAAAAGDRGFDLVLEMLANVNLPLDLRVLAKGGRVIVVGSRGSVEIDPRMTMSRDADIRGMTLFNTPLHDLEAIHRALGEGLQRGDLSPVVAAELPLAEAAAAHERVIDGPAAGNVVLVPEPHA